MAKIYSKKEKTQAGLFALAVIIMIFGILFLLTAGKMAPVFPGFYNIEHMLVQYIIVILTMACGIMLFTNVAVTLEDKKLRNAFTIGITTFSTVLTLPLLYVFIALYPAMDGKFGPVGNFMVKDIAADFQSIFTSDGAQYAIYAAGIVLSIIFLAFPLLTGILAVKGKAIKLGKGGISIGTLPVLEKQNSASDTISSCGCGCEGCGADCACLEDAASDCEENEKQD